MIRVELERNPAGKITGFRVEGHAGYKEKGEDVVCAAVSVLTQTAVISMRKLLHAEPAALQVEEGYLLCRIKDAGNSVKDREMQLILSSMALGLEETAREYGDYLELKYRESI